MNRRISSGTRGIKLLPAFVVDRLPDEWWRPGNGRRLLGFEIHLCDTDHAKTIEISGRKIGQGRKLFPYESPRTQAARPSRSEVRPSERVVGQRIRNRVIEYLELASSFDQQRDFDRRVCAAHEIIEMWVDWTGPDHQFADDVYTDDERKALSLFHTDWEMAANATSGSAPRIVEVQQRVEWQRMRASAEQALATLMQRGKLSEETEAW